MVHTEPDGEQAFLDDVLDNSNHKMVLFKTDVDNNSVNELVSIDKRSSRNFVRCTSILPGVEFSARLRRRCHLVIILSSGRILALEQTPSWEPIGQPVYRLSFV